MHDGILTRIGSDRIGSRSNDADDWRRIFDSCRSIEARRSVGRDRSELGAIVDDNASSAHAHASLGGVRVSVARRKFSSEVRILFTIA